MLPNSELARLQSDFHGLLPDQANRLTATVTRGTMGGVSESWGTVSTGIACRLDPQSGRESAAGGAVQPFQTFILSLPAGTTITPQDRWEVGGVTYVVKSVSTGQSWPMVVQAVVEKL